MSYERRSYAGGAVATTIASGIDDNDLAISLTDATGWPTGSGGPFFAVIGEGTVSEEKVRVTSRSTTTLTIAADGRGTDGTTAASHSSGATISHCFTAQDADEANAHVTDDGRDDHSQYLTTGRHATAHGFAAWTPSYTNLTKGNGTEVARYTDVGGLVVARWSLVIGSTTSISGDFAVSLPVTAHASGYQSGVGGYEDTTSPLTDGAYSATVRIAPGGTTFKLRSAGGSNFFNGSVPVAYAAGDIISATLIYEGTS